MVLTMQGGLFQKRDCKDHTFAELKKEVIGGYILFTGGGEKVDVEVSKFYKTIDEVNIGTFPLRPKDAENRDLLVKFIESLIGRASIEILDESIPQKGLYYTSDEPKDAEYMILTIDKEVNDDLNAVLDGYANTIVMGKKGIEEAKDIQTIRYIAPITFGSYIKGYYRVSKANLIQVEDEEYPIRIKFDVGDWVSLNYPAKFGMPKWALWGVCKTKEEFFRHCKKHVCNL